MTVSILMSYRPLHPILYLNKLKNLSIFPISFILNYLHVSYMLKLEKSSFPSFYKGSNCPGFTGTVPVWVLLSRCPGLIGICPGETGFMAPDFFIRYSKEKTITLFSNAMLKE